MDHPSMQDTWLRGLYMLLFAVFFNIAEIVLTVVAVFLFIVQVFTGKPNERVKAFGQSLSTYIYQLSQYFTFNSDYRPYPFEPWPQGGPAAGEGASGPGAKPAAPPPAQSTAEPAPAPAADASPAESKPRRKTKARRSAKTRTRAKTATKKTAAGASDSTPPATP